MCWPEEAATDSVSWLLSFVDGDWIGKSFYKTPKSDRSTSPQSPDSISHVNIKCYVLYQPVLVNLTSFTNKKAIYFVILIIAVSDHHRGQPPVPCEITRIGVTSPRVLCSDKQTSRDTLGLTSWSPRSATTSTTPPSSHSPVISLNHNQRKCPLPTPPTSPPCEATSPPSTPPSKPPNASSPSAAPASQPPLASQPSAEPAASGEPTTQPRSQPLQPSQQTQAWSGNFTTTGDTRRCKPSPTQPTTLWPSWRAKCPDSNVCLRTSTA